jgi:hypothetical protein
MNPRRRKVRKVRRNYRLEPRLADFAKASAERLKRPETQIIEAGLGQLIPLKAVELERVVRLTRHESED